jgi:hypothetical protein
MGNPERFQRAGFEESARPSKAKVVMRYYIDLRIKNWSYAVEGEG